jgi:hypothetical protein
MNDARQSALFDQLDAYVRDGCDDIDKGLWRRVLREDIVTAVTSPEMSEGDFGDNLPFPACAIWSCLVYWSGQPKGAIRRSKCGMYGGLMMIWALNQRRQPSVSAEAVLSLDDLIEQLANYGASGKSARDLLDDMVREEEDVKP